MSSLKQSDDFIEITSEVKEDEELLWKGKPQKASFILSKSLQLLPIAIVWLAFDGTALSMVFMNAKGIPLPALIFICIFFAVHLIPVWLWIHSIVSANRKYKLVEYVFTDKRIISRENGILQSYYYKDLRRVSVKVGLIDKIFKVGDITVSGRKSVCLLDIDAPYAIGHKLQEFIDSFEGERSSRRNSRNYEYEEYNEAPNANVEYYDRVDDYSDYDDDSDEEFYDDTRFKRPSAKPQTKSYDNEFETSSHSVRFTSKPAPPENNPIRSDEDDYLDNIMGKIKDEEF